MFNGLMKAIIILPILPIGIGKAHLRANNVCGEIKRYEKATTKGAEKGLKTAQITLVVSQAGG